MAVMIPVMLLSRKLNGDDPMTTLYLRLFYGVSTLLCFLYLLYSKQQFGLWVKKHASLASAVVYVPGPKGMFDAPTGPKKYKKAVYSEAVYGKFAEQQQQMIMGLVMTCGMHYWKGMIVGLAIQGCMGPVGMFENVLVRRFASYTGLLEKDHGSAILEELTEDKFTKAEKTNVDENGYITKGGEGTPADTNAAGASALLPAAGATALAATGGSKSKSKSSSQSPSEILDGIWTDNSALKLPKLLDVIRVQKISPDTVRTPDRATPLMIACGLSKATPSSPEQVTVAKECLSAFLSLGSNPLATDKDGWTALHWAAFHNCPEAVKALLLEEGVVSDEELRGELADKADEEGKTAMDIAVEEKADGVIKFLKLFEDRRKAGATKGDSSMKQRKPATNPEIEAVD